MSSLSRYKKAGGFLQLLSLIETFGPQKRDKFIEMIEGESPAWAQAIREKALTIERIFSWPDQVSIEVLKGLPIKNMAVVIEGLKPEHKARMMVFFTPSDMRRLEDALLDVTPKPEEITSNMVKLVEIARKMLTQNDLRAEKFDETLLIPEEFESKLEERANMVYAEKMASLGAIPMPQAPQPVAAHAPKASSAAPAGAPGALSGAEVHQLQHTLAAMIKENKILKEESKVMREKLEQIRKIA